MKNGRFRSEKIYSQKPPPILVWSNIRIGGPTCRGARTGHLSPISTHTHAPLPMAGRCDSEGAARWELGDGSWELEARTLTTRRCLHNTNYRFRWLVRKIYKRLFGGNCSFRSALGEIIWGRRIEGKVNQKKEPSYGESHLIR